jgi:creatinine amidohydrolase
METLITTATSRDERDRGARVAVLPVGSFEQHGDFLPLITDTIVACAIARRLSTDYQLFLLPPLTLSCSHEHSGFAGTVSLTAQTLIAVVTDIVESLRNSGIERLAIVNGHGGNYVLSNIVQQANVGRPRMVLFPVEWSGRPRAQRQASRLPAERTCTRASWRSRCCYTPIPSWLARTSGMGTGKRTPGRTS